MQTRLKVVSLATGLVACCLLLCCSRAGGSPASLGEPLIDQTASATPAPQSVIKALAAADYAHISARIDRKLVPNLTDEFKPDRQQSFTLSGPGFSPFQMVPARYESTSEDSQEPSFRCGVYLLLSDGSTSFVRTLGYGNREAEVCSGLVSVGFMLMPSGPPRIILLYDGGSFNSPGKDPVILDWNPGAKTYISNDKIVDKLKNVSTVPAIKAQLKALQP